MESRKSHLSSPDAGISRREFLSGCAACAASMAVLSGFGSARCFTLNLATAPALGGDKKAKIRLVLMYPDNTKPIWPNINYDFDNHNKKVVDELRNACPGIDFLISEVKSENDAKKVVEQNGKVDGYVIYMSGCLWGNAVDVIASTGKPTVIADHLFAGSGSFLLSYGRAKRNGAKIAAVSSSKIEDIAEAARCIEALAKLRSTKIIVIGSRINETIDETFGTKTLTVEYAELDDIYRKIDPAKAKQTAENWTSGALSVKADGEEILKSAAMYHAMAQLMEKHDAHAIAINCLGGIYDGKMFAYPCLGFMQLNNDGFVGACEADQKSTVTMLLMGYLAGRPGYISDPVIDTSRNQIIYAHCVAPTKVYGPQGSSNPYHIDTHSEDRKGASVRSMLPLGEMTTTLEFDSRKKKVVMHQAISVENVEEDMACRTKLAAEVKGDVYKLLEGWDQWSWHRVTVYGDLKRQVRYLADMLGFEIVEEA